MIPGLDDVCGVLRAYAIANGLRSVELSVRADGRVALGCFRANGTTAAHKRGDLAEGSADPLPSTWDLATD